MPSTSVLISGAGIAGTTLAHWLIHHGSFEVTLVESAPQLRTGGFVVDFWGAGYDIAERMGILPDLQEIGYRVREVQMVNGEGKRVGHFPVDALRRALQGRLITVPRSGLAAAIAGTLRDGVQTIFGDSVNSIEQHHDRVDVRFEHGPPRAFDLVIGADGAHSRVRALVFGKDRFERYLGMQFAAFELDGYRPRDVNVYLMYNQVGRQTGRFTLHSDRSLFLFVFASGSAEAPDDEEEQKEVLRRRFAEGGWECPAILAQLDRARNFYFDRVSQIRMDGWSRGRVALVGDAAFAPSFLAGQGSALAMLGAYVLAGELKASPREPSLAFLRYHQRLGELMARKQRAAVSLSDNFAPSSRLSVFLKNHLSSAVGLPFVANLLFGRLLRDRIPLPTY